MKKLFIVCVLTPIALTACNNIPTINIPTTISTMMDKIDVPTMGDTEPLNIVELKYPNATFIFPSGKKFRAGAVFPPPKTIDCSNLTLKTDSFEDAIEAGALVVRIQTPSKVKQIFMGEDGKEFTKTVKIKPVYGGVLALCNVSVRATGPDSRSYRIRGLDNHLAKGRDGLISVVGAVLDLDYGSRDYSWMLWLTDRTATFTDYEAEVSRRKVPTTPKIKEVGSIK